jgi:hypothetical protein
MKTLKLINLLWKKNKLPFVIPIIILFALLVILLVSTSGTNVDPFVYAIF